MGLGGSLPAVFVNPNTKDMTKEEYGAFPYENEEEMDGKLRSLMSNTFA